MQSIFYITFFTYNIFLDIFWILTRDQVPSEKIWNHAINVAKDFGIDPEEIVQINQEDCMKLERSTSSILNSLADVPYIYGSET